MFFQRKLACSFCGKTAAQVSKLVAGRRAYICDACTAEAQRLMSDSGGAPVRVRGVTEDTFVGRLVGTAGAAQRSPDSESMSGVSLPSRSVIERCRQRAAALERQGEGSIGMSARRFNKGLVLTGFVVGTVFGAVDMLLTWLDPVAG